MSGKSINLTAREIEVWNGLANSETTKGLALRLNLSPKTIEYHRANLYKKLGVYDIAAITRMAMNRGMFEI
jgi:DNA-binding NarL/FixJ family response regulator